MWSVALGARNCSLAARCHLEVSARKSGSNAAGDRGTGGRLSRTGSASLTVSIGVTSFPDSGITNDALLKAADTSLYQAKAAGRNCVVVSQPNWLKLKAGAIDESGR